MKFFSKKLDLELVCLLLIICYTVFINNKGFYYDEPYYLDNVRLLNELGFSKNFLLEMGGPAGPLHSFFFWLLQPLTSNNVAFVRLINPLFLLIIIVFSRKIYKLISVRDVEPYNQQWVSGVMFIPMTYVSAGMALTEMPALCMLVLSLYFLLKSDLSIWDYKMIFSSIFLSFAILGRQPYLLLPVPFAIWIWYNNRTQAIKAIIYLIFSITLPLMVFLVWKGLVPFKGGDLTSRKLFSIRNFFLGFGYASLCMVFINRKFFMPLKRFNLPYIILTLVAIIVLWFTVDFNQPLMKTFIQNLIPNSLFPIYKKLTDSILVLTSIYFIASLLHQLKKHKSQKNSVLMLICLGIMIASCAKITHQFSSRYVFQASIFMILATTEDKKDKKQIILGIIGAIVGMASLYSYYWYEN